MFLDPRPEFHRARVEPGDEGELVAYSTGGQRSSRAISLRSANALISLPAKETGGPEKVQKGQIVYALLIDSWI